MEILEKIKQTISVLSLAYIPLFFYPLLCLSTIRIPFHCSVKIIWVTFYQLLFWSNNTVAVTTPSILGSVLCQDVLFQAQWLCWKVIGSRSPSLNHQYFPLINYLIKDTHCREARYASGGSPVHRIDLQLVKLNK